MQLDRDRLNEARPTWFGGILYRSQTEARWAVFLVHMDIPFEYEERHFDLADIFYRPDFWLPKQNCWLEVKGPYPTRAEKEKARRLAAHEQRNVYLCFGDTPDPEDPAWYTGSCINCKLREPFRSTIQFDFEFNSNHFVSQDFKPFSPEICESFQREC